MTETLELFGSSSFVHWNLFEIWNLGFGALPLTVTVHLIYAFCILIFDLCIPLISGLKISALLFTFAHVR